jgi:hypothetical protein
MSVNRDDEWRKAKEQCRLSDEEVRMARELGMGPRGLIKNIPNPQQRWKAPVSIWIRTLYEKKFGRPAPARREASGRIRARIETSFELEFEHGFGDSGPAMLPEIEEENERMLRRQRQFRLAADYVAEAFAAFEAVQKIVLFGSVALPLEEEVPRFRKFRRTGQPIFHQYGDVDLALWLTDLSILKSLQRARGRALNDLFAIHEIGVAHHQVDVFLFASETGAYLGRLCNFGECPKRKPECLVQNCGAEKFLRQFEGFVFRPDALFSDKTIMLFDRCATTADGLLDDSFEIPF